ncbi:sigma-70 family RNA polymerase sigma factor [Streptomyces sp. NPDC047061]|uniref:sigma-70 family RNA polymerase sigma factor n=1 Tax=Streptomyces sp. NPDC047061 TaxID=3154605 RepID=UPI0033DF034C
MNWTMMGSAGSATAQEREIRRLYDECVGPLFTYVMRLLGGDRYRAEDVVQEALLRCWRTQDLDNGESLRPWLFRVARNLVIDEYRLRMTRPQEVNGNPWLDDVSTDSDDCEQVLSALVLQEAFKRLSDKHREVLYETYFTGRSTREAALVLGVPPGTVKSRTHHAIRALRLAMGVAVETGEEETAARRPATVPSLWEADAA